MKHYKTIIELYQSGSSVIEFTASILYNCPYLQMAKKLTSGFSPFVLKQTTMKKNDLFSFENEIIFPLIRNVQSTFYNCSHIVLIKVVLS